MARTTDVSLLPSERASHDTTSAHACVVFCYFSISSDVTLSLAARVGGCLALVLGSPVVVTARCTDKTTFLQGDDTDISIALDRLASAVNLNITSLSVFTYASCQELKEPQARPQASCQCRLHVHLLPTAWVQRLRERTRD